LGNIGYRVLVRYSKSDEMRVAEMPANWTLKLREIFDHEEAVQRQEEITAQEEMRFGEREQASVEAEIDVPPADAVEPETAPKEHGIERGQLTLSVSA
jgi:hypothetical protein